jgi:hypothetical protein
MKTFDDKDSAEKVVLTFDFSADLDVGETLNGAIGVTVSVARGSDATPANILNGAAAYDITSTKVLQGVQGGSAGCGYLIKVVAPTTNVKKVLALSGLLPVPS